MLHLQCRLLRPQPGRHRNPILTITTSIRSNSSHHHHHHHHPLTRRFLVTLAIETSCDDTAVAVLQRSRHDGTTNLLFNRRISSDNRAFKGINPVVAVASHNASLAPLVREALRCIPGRDQKPDFVCATRGPGIMSNLAVGLNMAKGLAVAWGVPLVGVHHMQAHALTPRLVRALERKPPAYDGDDDDSNSGLAILSDGAGEAGPAFPFLSLLVSGGHTQLVHSSSLTDHRIIASTLDIAIGNLLDQTARTILPESVLQSSPDVMYGRMLEAFAFPPLAAAATQILLPPPPPPSKQQQQQQQRQKIQGVDTGFNWSIPLPFKNTRRPAYSFASIHMHVHRILEANPAMPGPERQALARHTLRAAFQHLVSRLVLSLEDTPSLRDAKTLVVAGGVASNRFLMHVLRTTLAARGFGDVEIVAPPAELCTDNAAMIAWAGMEMYEAGWCSDLSVLPVAKWPMDPQVGDGIMGVGGWVRRNGDEG
ncbi:hypothetical protein PT974_08573 [Cladobotryum mycophilum]|uniref:N(6)-L-threonylcarbamoyladenine synthase n=1 Tax=Cladobotryum mycophilum TaxID=491253 RepID=A0ABR0SF33_9HYPO